MVKYYHDQLDETFRALSDPTRRAILGQLMGAEASVSELASHFAVSLPAIMKHLKVLEQAGLISQKKSGRTRYCRLAAEPLRDAVEWISGYQRFWERQFDSLARHVEKVKKKR